MDMYQKRKMRQEKKENNESENIRKVQLSWYPGHMYKAKRDIEKELNLVDIVVEIVDARIPISSRNPDIERIIRNKKKLIILNKSDLADDVATTKWIQYFKNANIPAIAINANTGVGVDKSVKLIEEIVSDIMQTNLQKGRVGRKIKAMVVGIPNVGKSSYINRLTKKKIAGVENKPGYTKKNQWYRVNDKIELLDTPGILWPKFEENVGINLAMTGTIKEDILDKTEIAYYIVKFMLEKYKNMLITRYKLDEEKVKQILHNENNPENENIYEIMKEIGRKRGAVVSGGEVDDNKISKIIIDEFKSGKIGKVTLECPR